MAVTTHNPPPAAVHGAKWMRAAFGLVAMPEVVLRFGSYFAEMGLGHALVQRCSIDRDDVRATIMALPGLTVAGLAWLKAPLAVFFLKNAAVLPLVRAQARGFIVVGLGATATSLLRREMRFAAIAEVEVVAYGGASGGLARQGAGVWRLVASLAQQLVAAVGSYPVVRHPLRGAFRRAPYARLPSYGGRTSASGVRCLRHPGSGTHPRARL